VGYRCICIVHFLSISNNCLRPSCLFGIESLDDPKQSQLYRYLLGLVVQSFSLEEKMDLEAKIQLEYILYFTMFQVFSKFLKKFLCNPTSCKQSTSFSYLKELWTDEDFWLTEIMKGVCNEFSRNCGTWSVKVDMQKSYHA